MNLALNLFQGLLALLVFLLRGVDYAIAIAYVLFGINIVIGIFIAVKGWMAESQKGEIREVIELTVQFVAILGSAVYYAFNGGLTAQTPTPFGLWILAIAVVLINWGPVTAKILRYVADGLEFIGGYSM